ncbi:AraC family transcriptional regulator [Actinokineospora sp.]|uniref:AraC family transcriptional regulator n=1 Tax=Actinokineospora sp. TaxID=1872133 RepID=UPI004037F9F7
MSRDAREVGGAWTRFQNHSFPAPSPDLAPFVDRYWIVSWDYPEPYKQLVAPNPSVHLTFRDGAAEVHGVSSGPSFKLLAGTGRVLGVAFRPGCFRPFLRSAVSTITDRSVPAHEAFAREVPWPAEVADIERFLRAHLPDPDPMAEWVAGVVARIGAEPAIARVDGLADLLDTSVRTLQRQFAEYVGIGPKWVIRRYRLHEATQRMVQGAVIDWAGLAAELGYADQPHFIRDFTAMFGESPTRYAGRY